MQSDVKEMPASVIADADWICEQCPDERTHALVRQCMEMAYLHGTVAGADRVLDKAAGLTVDDIAAREEGGADDE